MALTYEDVLGRPIETLEDAVLASAAFAYTKRGSLPEHLTALEAAEEDINHMSNMQLLEAISAGLGELK